MNPPAQDIKDMLDSTSSGAGVGTFATDLFCYREPPSPDACVTVYDTGGMPPDPQAGLQLEYPTVQVRVRGAPGDTLGAASKMAEVHAALHGDTQQMWNGARYLWIFAEGSPLFLGFDDNDRPRYTQNFRIARTPTT